jgi:hypothetical protein
MARLVWENHNFSFLLTMAPSPKEIITLADSGDDDGAESSKPSSSSTFKEKRNGRGVLPHDDDADDSSSVEYVGAASPEAPPAAKKARIHQFSTVREITAVRKSNENNGVEEEEDDRKPAAVVKKEKASKDKNNKDHAGRTRLEDEDADIQMMDAPHMVPEDPPPNIAPFASLADQDEKMKKSGEEEDEEVAVVGTRNRIRLPHMRQHCTDHPFGIGHGKVRPQFVTRLQQNTAHCHLCYCYVCDVLADQCNMWATHCYGTDAGPEAPYYKRLRHEKRIEKERSLKQPPTTKIAAVAAAVAAAQTPADDEDLEGGVMNHQANECMYCKARLGHGPILCEQCGRTGSKYYYKERRPKMTENKALLYLGTRAIPFRLVTRDLRKIPPYAQHWERHAGEKGWKIDLEAEALDAYQRRLGCQPQLNSVMAVLSPFRDENAIPESAPAVERDAIFLDDPKEASLLRALQMCNPEFGSGSNDANSTKRVGFLGNISVAFDAKQRRGVSFLPLICFFCIDLSYAHRQ